MTKPIFYLFDDPQLDRHIRFLQSTAVPQTLGEKMMHYGTVSSWNDQRAFGWILADAPVDGVPDKELFCHKSGLPKGLHSLSRGSRVEFVTRKARAAGKPPEAKVIRIIELAQAA